MPSPFPGMDPYLEAADIWPDLHDALAGGIRNELNQMLPHPYYARLEMRQELGIIEEPGERQRIVPDIVVVSHPRALPQVEGGGVAVATRTRREISPNVELEVFTEPIRHLFVEIRDPTQGHKLITLIEILSPSNKRSGPDREAYANKQGEVLNSDASLIELDLLRGGRRSLDGPGPRGDDRALETEAGLCGPGQPGVAAPRRGGHLPGLSGRPARAAPVHCGAAERGRGRDPPGPAGHLRPSL